MKVSLIVPKTKKVMDLENNSVDLVDLPEEIQNEFDALDVIRQKHRDALFAFEQAELLLMAKQQQCQRILEIHFKAKDASKPETP